MMRYTVEAVGVIEPPVVLVAVIVQVPGVAVGEACRQTPFNAAEAGATTSRMSPRAKEAGVVVPGMVQATAAEPAEALLPTAPIEVAAVWLTSMNE